MGPTCHALCYLSQSSHGKAKAATACVPKKWKNVRALHVKSPESVALPLYSAPGTGSGNTKAAKRKGAAAEEQGRVKRSDDVFIS
ncbi:hypothetical protein ACP4OV_004373 [Aristida adscensionis]